LRNDFEKDIKIKCIENGVTQRDLGYKVGTTGQYVNRIINHNKIINNMFVRMMEALGYDIQVSYVKRKDADD
jgi:plasmid maintenance system antidote protein VapI